MANRTRGKEPKRPKPGPGRRFNLSAWWPAPASAELERRALLAGLVAADATLSTAAFIGPVSLQATAATTTSATADNPAHSAMGPAFGSMPLPGYWKQSQDHILHRGGQMPVGEGDGDGGGSGGGGAPGMSGGSNQVGPRGFGTGPGRIELAQAIVQVAGKPVREVAFGDNTNGTIAVVVGGNTYNYTQQIDHPESLAMADLNHDGSPDLIVVNSGEPGQGGSVLVFPGLPGGSFGPTPQSFPVGLSPVGVTVGAFDGTLDAHGHMAANDLIIANSGSDNVTLLQGQGQGADWTMNQVGTIPLPKQSGPVSTALVDVVAGGEPDLFVCNSLSGTVMLFQGQGGGQFDTTDPRTFDVGSRPGEIFVGRFDRTPGVDLVTVNSGSNDLTFVSGVFGPDPTTTSIGSGGTEPDAAFAVDLNQGGAMSLVVANGGDGRVALLQPSLDGMELAGVISQPDLPAPTSLVPGDSTANGLDLFAATAGLDAAAILHFDFGTISDFLAVPTTGSALSPADAELVSQLTSIGESPLDLVAILSNGGGGEESASPSDHESALNALFYARTEGQGGDEGEAIAATSARSTSDELGEPASRQQEAPADPSSWLGRLLGLGEDGPARPDEAIEPLAARDAAEIRGDRGQADLAGLARAPADPDAEAASGAVDEALRSLWSDAGAARGPDPECRPPVGLGPRPGLGTAPAAEARRDEARPVEVGSEMAPVVSSSLFAARLVLKASPPRPPAFRKAGRKPARFAAWAPA